MKKRVIALALGCTVAFGCAVGGTLAWLTDSTDAVTNVFTTSNVDIELQESSNDYQMVPGHTIAKDPKVTVKAGSEPCWLFVEVKEAGGKITVDQTTYEFDDFIDYKLLFDDTSTTDVEDNLSSWTAGEGTNEGQNGIPTNVYYKKIDNVENDISFNIIGYRNDEHNEANQVRVKDTVTKEMMQSITDGNKPTLTFIAYATQLYKDNSTEFTAAEAWDKVKPSTN